MTKAEVGLDGRMKTNQVEEFGDVGGYGEVARLDHVRKNSDVVGTKRRSWRRNGRERTTVHNHSRFLAVRTDDEGRESEDGKGRRDVSKDTQREKFVHLLGK